MGYLHYLGLDPRLLTVTDWIVSANILLLVIAIFRVKEWWLAPRLLYSGMACIIGGTLTVIDKYFPSISPFAFMITGCAGLFLWWRLWPRPVSPSIYEGVAVLPPQSEEVQPVSSQLLLDSTPLPRRLKRVNTKD